MDSNIKGAGFLKKELCKLDLKTPLVLSRGEGDAKVLALVSVFQRPLTGSDYVWVTLTKFYSGTGTAGRKSIPAEKPFPVNFSELFRPAPYLIV